MDDIWQGFSNLTSFTWVVVLVALVLLYLVIRLGVSHALRDHARWVERKRIKATRTTYPPQAFPPITPESSDPF
ncbi:MAG: hypothetical protein KF801_00930 [Cryobacterium sp.]|nr:hypothetical protein [Cryobacterium sp.]